MSLLTDKKFINLISPKLRNFKWKKENNANCSCPICGDSQKDKRKARGYFYEKHGRFFYKCFNCGHWSNIYDIVKTLDPQLSKEYLMESLDNNSHRRDREKKVLFGGNIKPPKIRNTNGLLDDLIALKDLPSNHPAAVFANQRIIPKQHWNILYYTDDFGSFMEKMDPDSTQVGAEPRLVIPFYNKHGDIVAAQGRAINHKDEANARKTIKYLTVKADKSIDRLWYGLWRCNPKKKVYVVEGPIDSLFLKNAVAMVGAGALRHIPKRIIDSDIVFVLDNEPRNKQIAMYNEKLIEMGMKVCIWSPSTKEKDINDMAYRKSTRDIQKEIDSRTFQGLEAKVKLMEWRRG